MFLLDSSLNNHLLTVLALQASFGRALDIHTLCRGHHAATVERVPGIFVECYLARLGRDSADAGHLAVGSDQAYLDGLWGTMGFPMDILFWLISQSICRFSEIIGNGL